MIRILKFSYFCNENVVNKIPLLFSANPQRIPDHPTDMHANNITRI